MKDSKVTIIRTAVGSLSSVGLTEELRKRGIRVVGTDSNPLSAGLYFCDRSYVVPEGNSPYFLREILEICRKEKINAILPSLEEEQLILAKNKNIFNKKNILVLAPDYKIVKICSDKTLTYDFFEKEKIPTPETYTKNNVKFPVIIKPRFGRGSLNIFKAKNKKELDFYSKKTEDPIIQEFIGGMEYSVDILSDLNGESLSIIPRIRIQVESGISLKGKTVYNKAIIDFCRQIVKKLRLIGPACIQCIKDKKEPKFIEINTRFGGGSVLSIKADPTIVSNLIRIIKGEKPSKGSRFKEGLTMLRYYSELYTKKL